jgi:SAM-dependent methyltransferase
MGEEPASVSFDRAAEFYDATRDVGDEATEKTLDVLAEELRGRGRALEVGVGTGILAAPLSDRGFDIVGIDLSAAMLGKLLLKTEGRAPLPLVRADATRLPFHDCAFGAAYGRHVLHLIPRWRTAVAELCRVVGNGVVVIEAGGAAATRWLDLWKAMRSVLGPEADHVGLDTDRDGRAALDEAFAAAGALPRPLEEIIYPDEDTVAGLLDEVQRRSPSWTWRVPDEQLHRAIDVGRRWTLDRYGTLDVRLEETASVRWRAYDVGR